MEKNVHSTSTVERALDILWLMYKENREMGVTEIAQSIGVYKSAVHRALIALQKKGFVEQNVTNGKYWLGMSVFSLGMAYRNKITLRDICRPFLDELGRKLNETVHLGMLDKNESNIILIDRIETKHLLTMAPPIGSGSPAYCSGIGKAILSFRQVDPRKILAGDLQKFTVYTITELKNLEKEFQEIREKGYSVDHEELEIGLTCVAAPVFGKEGFVAGISVAGPTGRFQGERFMQIVTEVKNTAEEISRKLCY